MDLLVAVRRRVSVSTPRVARAVRLARQLRTRAVELDRRALWSGALLALLSRMTREETDEYYRAIRVARE